MESKLGKKPLIGARRPSSGRPASGMRKEPTPSNYKGGLASSKYLDGPNDFNALAVKNLKKDSMNNFGYEELMSQSG